jgi:hypothetical protein
MSRGHDIGLGSVRAVSWPAIAILAAVITGCWDDHPCDPDQIVVANACLNAPSGGGGGGTGGGGSGAGGVDAGAVTIRDSANDDSNFGKPCSTTADCSGDAPVCGQPYAPHCTQTQCGAGEANADVCPSGWQCLMIPGAPSVCSQL